MSVDKPVSNDSMRRFLAKKGALRGVVQRLTERGVIRPDEEADMFDLLSACSDFPPMRQATAGQPAGRTAKHRKQIPPLR